MEWIYKDKPVELMGLDKYFGFVYVVENLTTGKRYFGKKKLRFVRRKKLKSKKRRITTIKDSDWKDYYGSSKELLAEIEVNGKDNYRREIIRFGGSAGECSYWELWYQMTYHVLLHPEDFYNNYVGARIHRKHIMKGIVDGNKTYGSG